jgi:iron-sulfur cluster assembly protein
MIEVTEKALNHILKLRSELGEGNEKFFLRVGVKGGGCSGFSYTMDFDNEITDKDEVIVINNDLTLVINKVSLLYIFGTELNYSDGLNGKGFHWINPQATRVCGCGESFAV